MNRENIISLLLKVEVANSSKKQLKSIGAIIIATFSQRQRTTATATVKVAPLQYRFQGIVFNIKYET